MVMVVVFLVAAAIVVGVVLVLFLLLLLLLLCQICCTLPMYVSHLLHVYTSYLLWLKVKKTAPGERVTSCD